MVKFSELYRLLESHGWTLKKGKRKGGNDKYVHPDFDYFIPVGRHKSQEVPSGTLRGILKDAGIEETKKKKQ